MTNRFRSPPRDIAVQFSDASDSNEERLSPEEPSPFQRHRIARISVDRLRLLDKESTSSSTLVDSSSSPHAQEWVKKTHFPPRKTFLQPRAIPEDAAAEADDRPSSAAKVSKAFDRILRNSVLNGTPIHARRSDYYADVEEDKSVARTPMRTPAAKVMQSTPRSKYSALSTPHLPGHYASTTPHIPRTSFKSLAAEDAHFQAPSPKTPHWPGEYKSVVLDDRPDESVDYHRPEASTSTAMAFRASNTTIAEEDEMLSQSLSKIRLEHLSASGAREVDGSIPESIEASDDGSEEEAQEAEALPSLPPNSLKARLLAKRRSIDLQASQLDKQRRHIAKDVKRRHSDSDALSKRLKQAERLQEDLRQRALEIRSTIEDVGVCMGAKISQSVAETLQTDSTRRHRWLWCALAAEVAVLCFLYSYMNARLRHDFHTRYYDPFNGFLYPAQLAPYVDIALPAETLALFGSYAYSATPAEAFRGWLGTLLSQPLRFVWTSLAGVEQGFGYVPT